MRDEVSTSLETFYGYHHRKKVLTIVLLGLVLHLSLIAIDQAAYHGLIPLEYGRGPDIWSCAVLCAARPVLLTRRQVVQ